MNKHPQATAASVLPPFTGEATSLELEPSRGAAHPFTVGDVVGTPIRARPHRMWLPAHVQDDLRQRENDAALERLYAFRDSLNRPSWVVRIGRRIGLDVLLLTLVGILGWGLLFVGLYAWVTM